MTTPAYQWGVLEPGDDPEWTTRVLRDGALIDVPHTEETARATARSRYLYEATLIRRTPGTEGHEVVPYAPAVLPPPAAADLCHDRYAGVDIGTLGEDYDWIVALGWVDRAQMAHAVTLWTRTNGEPGALYKPRSVEHVYARRVEAWGCADWSWIIQWEVDGRHVCSAEQGAFRFTVVDAEDRADLTRPWQWAAA